MTNVWGIRAGVAGVRERFNLESGLAGGGFVEVADLAACDTREKVRAQVVAGLPAAPEGKIRSFTGQLMRGRLTSWVGKSPIVSDGRTGACGKVCQSRRRLRC
jgi:predicted Mrr-cat superfamily restriction endonuclease